MSAHLHIDRLKELLAIDEQINRVQLHPYTATIEIAADIMRQMGQTVGALLRFLVGSVDAPPQSVRIEPGVVAAITRMLIEQRETFVYLCLGRLSEPEREFRREVYWLHRAKEAAQIIPQLPKFYSPDEDTYGGMMEASCRLTLENNSFFQALDPKARNALLSGRSAFYNSATGRFGRGATRDAEITALYKLFSNVLHGTSLGVHAARTTTYRTRIDGHNLVALALCCSVRIFARSLNEYTKLRPKLRRLLTTTERAWLLDTGNYALQMWPRLSEASKRNGTSAPW